MTLIMMVVENILHVLNLMKYLFSANVIMDLLNKMEYASVKFNALKL